MQGASQSAEDRLCGVIGIDYISGRMSPGGVPHSLIFPSRPTYRVSFITLCWLPLLIPFRCFSFGKALRAKQDY